MAGGGSACGLTTVQWGTTLRLVFAAVFGYALVNLLDVAQLVGGAEQSVLQGEQL